MTCVVVFYRDTYPVKHMFNVFAEALAYASLVYNEEFVQAITITYERTTEK